MAKLLTMDSVQYVLKFERDSNDDKTIWHLRPLKWKERAEVQDGMIVTEINMLGPKTQTTKGTMRHLSGTQAKMAVEKGLVKIEGLRSHDGQLIKYDHDMSQEHRDGILDRIPPEWTKEIAEEILKMSGLMKEEEKN
jgi:hypothetical protein